MKLTHQIVEYQKESKPFSSDVKLADGVENFDQVRILRRFLFLNQYVSLAYFNAA